MKPERLTEGYKANNPPSNAKIPKIGIFVYFLATILLIIVLPPVGIIILLAGIYGKYRSSHRTPEEQAILDRKVSHIRAAQEHQKQLATPTDKSICPKCGCTDIAVVNQNDKKFSAGRALGGTILAGGIGSLAGFTGNKNKIVFVCKKCGHQWK